MKAYPLIIKPHFVHHENDAFFSESRSVKQFGRSPTAIFAKKYSRAEFHWYSKVICDDNGF